MYKSKASYIKASQDKFTEGLFDTLISHWGTACIERLLCTTSRQDAIAE